MNPESTPHKINTPYGVLYVAVAPAKQDRFYDTDRRTDVTVLVPRLRIASDAAFEADPNAAEHWTIRGRAYGVHQLYYFRDLTHVVYSNGRRGGRWHLEDNPHRGGFRNDKRLPVEFGTATYEMMDLLVTNALNCFAADRPGWTQFSEYLHLTDQEKSARCEASRLETELHRAVEKANDFAGRAWELGAKLPDWCLDAGA